MSVHPEMPSMIGRECNRPPTRSHGCELWSRRDAAKAGNTMAVPSAGIPAATLHQIQLNEAGEGPCGLLSRCHSEHSVQGSSGLIWPLKAWLRDCNVLSWRV